MNKQDCEETFTLIFWRRKGIPEEFVLLKRLMFMATSSAVAGYRDYIKSLRDSCHVSW